MHKTSPFREAGITLMLLRTVSLQAHVLPLIYSKLACKLIAAWTDSMLTVMMRGERKKGISTVINIQFSQRNLNEHYAFHQFPSHS